jgi:RNA polymerase sigma factor (sigma-70 family)
MRLTETIHVPFEQHHIAVLNYCRRRTDLSQAEDAAAQVMEIAWRRRSEIPADFELPYLYGIAYKVLANQRRAQHRQARAANRVRIESTESAEEVVLAAEDAQRIRDGLHRLSAADQEILRLSAWEHMSREEIAIVLSISPNAVTKKFNRALDHLAAELGTVRHRGSQFFRRTKS